MARVCLTLPACSLLLQYTASMQLATALTLRLGSGWLVKAGDTALG